MKEFSFIIGNSKHGKDNKMKIRKKILVGTIAAVVGVGLVGVNADSKLTLSAMTTQEENKTDLEDVYIERHPEANGGIEDKLNKMPKADKSGYYDFRYADLSKLNLTKEKDKLIRSDFSSITIWPKKLPNGFNPEKIVKQYKNPGLNIRKLHKKGITGKNVGIAIIDQTLLVDHVEYKDQLKYYKEGKGANNIPAEIHGAAVASIAVGKSVGVAPEADLYYFAESFMQKNPQIAVAKDILQVIELNKKLSKNEKIRVISISWGCEDNNKKGYEDYMEALKCAKEEGIFVISTTLSNREDMKGENLDYMGLGRKGLSSPDDFTAYIHSNWDWADEEDTFGPNTLCGPMNNMCIAAPTGIYDYVVYSSGGLSWTTPYIAGVYALACQVDPDITYKEFWKVALKTAISNETNYKGKKYVTSKIINPVGIMEELQK